MDITEQLNQLNFGHGVIQELTSEDHESGVLLKVRWKKGITLELFFRWRRYWIRIIKDDSIFASNSFGKELYIVENLQKAVKEIERGQFSRKKSAAELVAEIISERQLTGCMNSTKWREFLNAMEYEMPFCPPYEMKTLFDKNDEYILKFADGDVCYFGDYSAESFAGLNYKIIEYIAVRPQYCEVQGGRLVQKKIIHDATEEFIKILKNYNIPYEENNGVYMIYGYK